MGSGKSTVAQYLQSKYDSTILSLAAPIKIIEKQLENDIGYGFIYRDNIPLDLSAEEVISLFKIFDGAKICEREYPKPRKRYQYIGTECRRQIKDSIWIEVLDAHAKKDPTKSFICDDSRFLNEYLYFREAGWIPIKLKIGKKEQHKRLTELYGEYDPQILQHQSETEVLEIFKADQSNIIDADLPKEKVLEEVDKIIKAHSV